MLCINSKIENRLEMSSEHTLTLGEFRVFLQTCIKALPEYRLLDVRLTSRT